MHIFCTKCGKHIDVSLEELENQRGHLVCPQCLAEIDVDVDLFNDDATVVPEEKQPTQAQQYQQQNTPPAYSSQRPPQFRDNNQTADKQPDNRQNYHVDDVMRYCKQCGTFLKEGVNFCPKCGKYVRVAPPSLKSQATPAQQAAAILRANTPPVHKVPANKQPKYRQPQEADYQAMPAKHRNSSSARASRNRQNRKNSWLPSFDIMSLKGCLITTVVVVAVFFIIYMLFAAIFEW